MNQCAHIQSHLSPSSIILVLDQAIFVKLRKLYGRMRINSNISWPSQKINIMFQPEFVNLALPAAKFTNLSRLFLARINF